MKFFFNLVLFCSYPSLGELIGIVKPGFSDSHFTRYYGDTFLAAIDKVGSMFSSADVPGMLQVTRS